MAEVGPGAQNVFVPTFDPATTGAIQAEFTRSPDAFPLNSYVQLIPVEAASGYYLRIETEEQARLVTEQEHIWPDGGDRPVSREADFEFVQYTTQRFGLQFRIGHKTREQARWDIVASHARIKAHKAMVLRTQRVLDVLTTAGNWGGNTGASTDTWDDTAAGDTDIQDNIRTTLRTIVQTTCNAVRPSDIIMIIGPTDASDVAASGEVLDYVKNQPAGSAFLQGNPIFDTWGLPSKLFGVNLNVEDTVRVSTRKGAAATTRAFMVDDIALFMSRPGGLVGVAGAPTFSTICLFVLEDMTVETADDVWNRRVLGSIVDDNDPQLVAPVSGFYMTNIHT
jgi:hypothetical protein